MKSDFVRRRSGAKVPAIGEAPSLSSHSSSTVQDSVRVAVENILSGAGVPGCSIALVDGRGPLWSDAFGFADLRERRLTAVDTVYHLFSGTKLFTAVAVLQLAERGLLDLDAPLTRFVPEAGAARGVTLLHLLSHRSGLKDTLTAFLSVSFPGQKLPTSGEALAGYRIVAARPPGRRVEYRNVNYALLGEVITRVSGVEYREYVSRQVLAPLGMDVGFGFTDGMRRRAATGYIGRWDPMRLALRWMFPEVPARLYGSRVDGRVELKEYDLATSAIGGLVGSVSEFAKFLQAQLAGGERGGGNGGSVQGAVLSPDSIRRMQTLVAEGTPGVESRVGIGLGWKVGRVGERTFLNHEGGGAGFTSELRLYPDAGLGIALAMNTMRMPATMSAAHRICEVALEAGVDRASTPSA